MYKYTTTHNDTYALRHHHHNHIRLFEVVKRNHTHSSSPVNTSSIVQQNIQFSPVRSVLQVIRRVSTNISIAYGQGSYYYLEI